MELVTRLYVILMLVGIVFTKETTTTGKEETPPTVIPGVESLTQNTTMPTADEGQGMKDLDIYHNETATPGKEESSPITTLSVDSSTQDTTVTETTTTSPGKGQDMRESEMCDNVLIFGGVGVALTIPITVVITLLIIWRRIGVGPLISCTRSDSHYSSVECNLFVKWAQFSRSMRVCWEFLQFSVCCRLKSVGTGPRKEELIGSELVLEIVPDTNSTEQSNNADEREYDQPHWNGIPLSDHIEPTGIEVENTEYENFGSCSRSSYEGLHPYENHGMNLYGSCSQEHIIQEETEEIGV